MNKPISRNVVIGAVIGAVTAQVMAAAAAIFIYYWIRGF